MERTKSPSGSNLKKSERIARLKIEAESIGLQSYSNVLRVKLKKHDQGLDKIAKKVGPSTKKLFINVLTSSTEALTADQGEDITEVKSLTSDLAMTSEVFLDEKTSLTSDHELKQTKTLLDMPADHSAKDQEPIDSSTESVPILSSTLPVLPTKMRSGEPSIDLDYPSFLLQKVIVPPGNESEPLHMVVSEKNLSDSTMLVKQNSKIWPESSSRDSDLKDVPQDSQVDQSSNETLPSVRMVTPRVCTEESNETYKSSLGDHQPDAEPKEEVPLAKSESGQLQSLEMTDLKVSEVNEPSVEVLESTQGSDRNPNEVQYQENTEILKHIHELNLRNSKLKPDKEIMARAILQPCAGTLISQKSADKTFFKLLIFLILVLMGVVIYYILVVNN